MLKIVSVAIIIHTEKAIGEVLSDVACPVFKGRKMRIEESYCGWTSRKLLLNVLTWSSPRQQSLLLSVL